MKTLPYINKLIFETTERALSYIGGGTAAGIGLAGLRKFNNLSDAKDLISKHGESIKNTSAGIKSATPNLTDDELAKKATETVAKLGGEKSQIALDKAKELVDKHGWFTDASDIGTGALTGAGIGGIAYLIHKLSKRGEPEEENEQK